MGTLGTPNKIYLCPSDRVDEVYEDEWYYNPWGEGCVEYTRTDAFIKKAEEWLRNNQQGFILTDKDITDFVNDMKGK